MGNKTVVWVAKLEWDLINFGEIVSEDIYCEVVASQ